MKSLSRILTVCLCCMPAFAVAAPVATTAGSNLTSYHPNNAYNNQWAIISNGRYDEGNNATAKVNLSNCNAVILRCAQPKCGNGGCQDDRVAAAIVDGCIKSNEKCKQYSDDLSTYLTAQLVASSSAKLNEQQAALAAAQATSAAQNEQINQMQNQMYQMQQQMQEQQEESARALQEALEKQQAQSAAALASMKSAATEAAKQTESGVTAYEQEAINRGISIEVLERKKITGQIMTEIENAETSLTKMRKVMQNSFEYAGCDSRGNNCSGPKRVKKWRELALDFIQPYDDAINNIYDALDNARNVGVDLSQIYAMLNDTCNSWSKYVCPGIEVGKDETSTHRIYYGYYKTVDGVDQYIQDDPRVCQKKDKLDENEWKNCQRCIWTGSLNEKDEVYIGWVNIDQEAKDNQIVVACSSSAIDNSKLFARRTRNKNGAGLVEIDLLEKWIEQSEPSKNPTNSDGETDESLPKMEKYCNASEYKTVLNQKVLSRVVNTENNKLGEEFCVEWNNTSKNWKEVASVSTDGCPYIGPLYAICDAHPYNAGITKIKSNQSGDQESIREILGLKITVVSQQMFKQYEYLNATLRRLKTQLEKAVLTATLEAAGAKSEGGSSGLAGGANSDDKTIYLAGANNCSNFMDFDSAYNCLQNNITVIKNNISNTKKACQQLAATVKSANSILSGETFTKAIAKAESDTSEGECYHFYKASGNSCSAKQDKIINCANAVNFAVMAEKRDQENKKQYRIVP